MPQDLLLLKTLDGRRAGVPACDPALRVEHIDGIIAHALHKHPQLQGAFVRRLFQLPLLGNVAGDLRKADERSSRMASSIACAQ